MDSRPVGSKPDFFFENVCGRLPVWSVQRMNKIEDANGSNEYSHCLQLEFLMQHKYMIFNSFSSSVTAHSSKAGITSVLPVERALPKKSLS